MLADIRQRIERVFAEAKKLGYEIDPDLTSMATKGQLWFECPTVHTDSGKQATSHLLVELHSGAVVLDQRRWRGPRAIRISLKERLTVKNNCLRWMLHNDQGGQ